MARITLLSLFIFLASCDFVYDNGGVENDKDKAVFKWGIWELPVLISIVDDSLALMATYKPYYKEWSSCGFDGCTTHDLTTNYRIGLFLVNYREKQKPVWGDILEGNLFIAGNYFKDSSVLVFDRGKDKFGFWKIGTNAKDVKLIDYANNSGYYDKRYIGFHARPLKNGDIALFGGAYASKNSKLLLEAKNKQLKLFEFSGEYEWLSKCANSLTNNYGYNSDDGLYYTDYNYDYVNVSYIGGELSCIKGNEATNNFELTVNNVVRDTSSLSKSSAERIINWYGNYVKDKSDKIHKIDTLNFKFDNSYAPIWIHFIHPSFYNDSLDSNGSVRYFAQDLIDFF